MTDVKSQKKGGGKLTRSETVTVRLDPRLRYLSELAARKQRRTLSSYIEWTLFESIKSTVIEEMGDQKPITLSELANHIWDVDPVTRLLNLAFLAGDLLSFEEQVLIKIIRSESWFLDDHAPEMLLEIKQHRVRQAWAAIESLAKYEISQEEFDSVILDLQESSND